MTLWKNPSGRLQDQPQRFQKGIEKASHVGVINQHHQSHLTVLFGQNLVEISVILTVVYCTSFFYNGQFEGFNLVSCYKQKADPIIDIFNA